MKKIKIAIIGLGYVGLPLAVEFGKHFETIGIDSNNKKLEKLKKKIDDNHQIEKKEFLKSNKLIFTHDLNTISSSNIIIVCVPTPVDKNNKPNLKFLKLASENIGKHMSKNSLVVFESTVYPGLTEEFCVPIIEKYSKLVWKKNFNIGYSPERVNPGDKKNNLKNIVKVVSADSKKSLDSLSFVYSKIIKAGLFKAKSIKVAEAAKIIENTQRDLNIALINELSIIFNKLNIDTQEVLDAAKTKWNFLNFTPGLVGGHCIGVDPYYLTHKSAILGYFPKVILSGRKINDNMHKHVSKILIKEMISKNILIKGSKVLILGLTFKENCNDIRNSKIFNLAEELYKNKIKVSIFDPIADIEELKINNKYSLISSIKKNNYDGVILAVPHKIFLKKFFKLIISAKKEKGVFFDLKSVLNKKYSDLRL